MVSFLKAFATTVTILISLYALDAGELSVFVGLLVGNIVGAVGTFAALSGWIGLVSDDELQCSVVHLELLPLSIHRILVWRGCGE